MKVRELIAQLQEFAPDDEVAIVRQPYLSCVPGPPLDRQYGWFQQFRYIEKVLDPKPCGPRCVLKVGK